MFCNKCGAEVKGGEDYCYQCGARLNPAGINMQNVDKGSNNIEDSKKNKSLKGGKKGSKKRKGLKIFLIIAILLLLTTAALLIYNIVTPLQVDCDSSDKTTTTSGTLEDFSVTIQSNLLVRKIYYAVDPIDPDNLEYYTEIKAKGGLFNKEITISELSIPAGESDLYIYVTTLFGQHVVDSIELKHNIGYTSAPEKEAYVTIGEGKELISNELLIIVNEGVSKSEVTSLIKPYEGEIVGQLYIMNQYQVRFPGYGEAYINDIKAQLEESELVDYISYNISFDIDLDETPNDTEYDSWEESDPSGNNWGLESIDAPSAWEYNDQMTPVKVGVIDSSLQYNHKDLQINKNHVSILATDDFKSLKDLEDYYAKHEDTHVCESENCIFCSQKDHGTHCVGIIGAIANNSKGICGVNWNANM